MKIRPLLLVLCAATLHSSQPPADIATNLGPRSLIILCDDSEATRRGSIALTSNLYYALKDCYAPIITSTHLWKNLVAFKAEGVVTDFTLDPYKWTIYASSDYTMLIFIPKGGTFENYLEKLNTFSVDSRIDIDSEKLSDGELLLGMKLRKLTEIKDPMNIPSPTSESQYEEKEKFGDYDDVTPLIDLNLREYLTEILITHGDLKKKLLSEYLLNRWDIYLSGHGTDTTIADLSPKNFESLLDFLNEKIETRSFFYSTCYAGMHLKKSYEFTVEKRVKNIIKEKEKRNKNFKFIIISATVFDVAVRGRILTQDQPEVTTPYISYFEAIHEYFRKISSPSQTGESKNMLVKAVDHFKKKVFNDYTVIAIRYPNNEWFTIPQRTDYFLLDDGEITRTINQNKSVITIKEESIVIKSHYIPLSLKIDTIKSNILFMPVTIQDATYYFKEIIMSSLDFLSLIKTIQNFSQELTSRLRFSRGDNILKFYIEKLSINVLDNTTKTVVRKTFKDVIINLARKYIVLEDNGKAYTISLDTPDQWKIGFLDDTSDSAIQKLANAFKAAQENIRKESTLPASMIADIPKPIMEQPLSHEYLKRKDKPAELAAWRATLTAEQQKAINYFEMYGDMPELEDVPVSSN